MNTEDGQLEYCSLFSHIPDMVLAIDEQGIILEANRAVCECLGYSRDEVLGKSIAEVVADPEVMERELSILKQRGRHECEIALLTREGVPVEALCSVSLIGDETCRPLFAVASFRDIGGLKQIQRELRAERDRFRAILRSSTDGILLLDEHQRIVEWSSALERISGFSEDEVRGKNLWEVMDWLKPDDVEGVGGTTPTREAFRRAFSAMLAGEPSEFLASPKPARIKARDGRIHHIEVSASPVDIEEGTKIVHVTGGHGQLLPRVVPERTRMLLAVVRDITERVEEEQRYRTLTEHSLSGIYIIQNSVFVYVNPRVCELVGYTEQELIGMPFWEVLHPDEREVLKERGIRRERGENVPPNYEFRVLTRDGKTKWVEVSATTIEWRGKRAILGSVFDITERKLAEEELKHRLELERGVSTISARFVGTFDLDDAINASLRDMGTLTGASRAYVFMLSEDGTKMSNTHEWCASGVSPQKDSLQSLPSEQFSWWMERLERGEVICIEDVSRLPDEARAEREILEAQDIRSLLVLPLRVGKRLAGFVGFDNTERTGTWGKDDITVLRIFSRLLSTAIERKLAEEQLKESEERFRRLTELLPDPLIELDLELNVRYANRAALHTFGCSKGEMKGLSALELIVPEEHSHVAERLERLLSGEAPEPIELRFRRKDGAVLVGEAHYTLLYHEGRVEAIACVIRDITERKRYEEELIEARREAELYTDLMAHDINNLNTVAYGYLSLLAEDEHLSEKQERAITRSLSSIEGVSRLISNVEKLREIAHRKRELVPIELDDVVQRALSKLSDRANVSIHYEPCDVKVWADELLEEVVSNLVGNAIKHGGRDVHVWIRPQPTDGHVRLIVEDDGKGVPDDIKPVIFNRLRRGKSSVHGKGLGLYIVSTLVEGYGGKVWVEDRDGGGARFVVELRRA